MDHLAQIQRAVDYIEDHLDGELQVDDIARVAGFSRWHFQHVFSAAVGDSLKDYIRARRLTKAMGDLTATDKRIIDIAIEAGFESQESFTRAFKLMYKVTPDECRKADFNPSHVKKPRITKEYLVHLYKGVNMQPRFINVPEMKVVGVAGVFTSILSPNKDNMVIIPQLWQKFMPRRHEIQNIFDSFNLGVCLEAPKERQSGPDQCLYFACTEVKDFGVIPEGMEKFIIPSGEYAVFTHKGKLDNFESTMKYIYGSWLPNSGKKLRNAPDIEFYDQRFKLNEEDSEVDIWIPVV